MKQTTGYRLQASVREIVITGRATCRVLRPNSTDAEVLGVAEATAVALDTPRQRGLAVVAAIYANFC